MLESIEEGDTGCNDVLEGRILGDSQYCAGLEELQAENKYTESLRWWLTSERDLHHGTAQWRRPSSRRRSGEPHPPTHAHVACNVRLDMTYFDGSPRPWIL